MNYSKELMTHMRAYAKDWDDAEKKRKSDLDAMKHWKEDSFQYTDAYQKIMQRFHEAIAPSYKTHLNACVDILQEAFKELKKVACGDVPESFIADITLIKAAQDKLSELHYMFYLEKYATSYPCVRSILDIARANGKCEALHLSYLDRFKEYIDECVRIVSNFFNGYGQPTGDITAKMAINTDDDGKEKNRICKIFRDYLDPFYAGDYYAAGIEIRQKQTHTAFVLDEGSLYTPNGEIRSAFETGNKI